LDAAKEQAAAAVQAAQIQADAALKAAEQAADVQARYGILSVGAAIATALLAALAAYIAATRQVRLDERHHAAKVFGYAASLRADLLNFSEDLKRLRLHAEKQKATALKIVGSQQPHTPIAIEPLQMPSQIHEEHWENHSLLDVRDVIRLSNLRHILGQIDEIRDHPRDPREDVTVLILQHPTAGQPSDDDPLRRMGLSLPHHPHHTVFSVQSTLPAADAYVLLAAYALSIVRELISSLEEQHDQIERLSRH
jgi:hypothetical protein